MRELRLSAVLATALLAAIQVRPVLAAEGAESVEALMKQVNAATRSGNAAQILPLIHPDDRPLYAFAMVMVGSFTPMGFANDEKKAKAVGAEWEALLRKHKIDMKPNDAPPAQDPAEMKMRARALFKGVDVNAFVTDAASFVAKYRSKDDKGAPIPGPVGTLEGLKVEGDTATGKIEGKDQRFTKVKDRWYIRVDM